MKLGIDHGSKYQRFAITFKQLDRQSLFVSAPIPPAQQIAETIPCHQKSVNSILPTIALSIPLLHL